jgi:hypothetical protein
MRRFIGILLFASLLAFAFAFSSLLPQHALAASASTLYVQQISSITGQPQTHKHWGHGYWAGYHDGYRDGYEIGLSSCYDFDRHRNGWTDEGNWAYRRGYSDGFRSGFDEGRRDCYDRGYDRGAGHDFHHGHHGHYGDSGDKSGHKDTHKNDDRHNHDAKGDSKH